MGSMFLRLFMKQMELKGERRQVRKQLNELMENIARKYWEREKPDVPFPLDSEEGQGAFFYPNDIDGCVEFRYWRKNTVVIGTGFSMRIPMSFILECARDMDG